MHHGYTELLVLILFFRARTINAQESGAGCRLSTEFPKPEVTPWDTSSIKVSWDKVFVNCRREDIKDLRVKWVTQINAYFPRFAKSVKFENKTSVLEARPCIRHTVHLVLKFIDDSRFTLESERTHYNRPSGSNFKSGDLYSGRLDTRVVQNICLNKTTDPVTVIVPEPPGALQDCIKTKGNQGLGLPTAKIGDNIKVKISVENPLGKANLVHVSSLVKNIQKCTECRINPSVAPLAETHNSSHLRVSWANVFQGCESFEIKNVTILEKGQKQTTLQMLDAKSVLLLGSPCSDHILRVVLNLRNSEKLISEEIILQAKQKDFCTQGNEELNTGIV